MTEDTKKLPHDLAAHADKLRADKVKFTEWLERYKGISDRLYHHLKAIDQQLEAIGQLEIWQEAAERYPAPELPELPELPDTPLLDDHAEPF